ncbi:MAG: squalene synthase HpnC [Bacteroidota bacterium]
MQNTLHSLAATHYENFPVGSRLIPARYREAIHLIYAFARTADDLADEGGMDTAERLTRLADWRQKLHDAVEGKPADSFFTALAAAIHRHGLSLQLFDDLLTAFRMDAADPVFSTFEEVLQYCAYSANPIGRLLLQIFKCSNENTVRFSDSICTALQLTNFWQDISVDTGRNRFYIPQEDLNTFGVHHDILRSRESSEEFRLMLRMQWERTRQLFLDGKPIFTLVAKEFRLELKLIWHGGMRILEKIEALNFDTRTVRPSLKPVDSLIILFRAIRA